MSGSRQLVCRHCGAELTGTQEYCPRCGTPTERLVRGRQAAGSCAAAFLATLGLFIWGFAFCIGAIGGLPAMLVGVLVGILYTAGASYWLANRKRAEATRDSHERQSRYQTFGSVTCQTIDEQE